MGSRANVDAIPTSRGQFQVSCPSLSIRSVADPSGCRLARSQPRDPMLVGVTRSILCIKRFADRISLATLRARARQRQSDRY